MAIAYDAASASAYSGATSVTWSHTCTGTDRILFVAAYCGTANTTTSTYNGVSMTAINSLLMTGAAAGQYIKLFYLIAPATGTNNVIVSCSAGDMYGVATSYTGASQTGQPDAQTTNGSATGTSLTTSVTTVADNSWLVGFSYMNFAISAGANTTLRIASGAGTVQYMMDSNGAKTPAGSHGLTTTDSTNGFSGHVIASFSPSAVATQNSNFFNFM